VQSRINSEKFATLTFNHEIHVTGMLICAHCDRKFTWILLSSFRNSLSSSMSCAVAMFRRRPAFPGRRVQTAHHGHHRHLSSAPSPCPSWQALMTVLIRVCQAAGGCISVSDDHRGPTGRRSAILTLFRVALNLNNCARRAGERASEFLEKFLLTVTSLIH
jgi:hypothetical protein